MIFQIYNKIIQEFSRYRIGKDITIKLFRKVVYMLDDCIINSRIVCRLTSGALFKNFFCKNGKVNTFYRFCLSEVVNVVLSRLGLKNRTRNR
nr:MAG TPA: hypothetical protein [Caudoviricetes sp.]